MKNSYSLPDPRVIPIQLIFDEIKIRCGVAYNASTGKEIGFTSSKAAKSLKFVDEILSFIKESDNGEETETSLEYNEDRTAATYANVWRIRTYRNETWNVGYFYNDGYLDSDELLKQLLIILSSCEILNFHVKLQMSDSGGANARMIALLCKFANKKYINGPPSINNLQYVNPLEVNRSIWASLCSVHGLKSAKKCLADKKLLFNKGVHLSWQVIQDLYFLIKDDMRKSMNVNSLRGLKRSVAFPDAYTRQNVANAKSAFGEQIISYQLHLLASDLNCDSDVFDSILVKLSGLNGYSGEILNANLML